MTNRKCYQCGDEDLSEVQARRKAEVRAWADASIAEANASLVGVPLAAAPVEDLLIQEIPDDQVVPSEEEAQAALDAKNDTSKNDADLDVDATAQGAAEQGDLVKTAKKATTKKA